MSRPPSVRVRRRERTRAVVVASLVGLAVAAGLVWLVVGFASENPEAANLGPSQFEAGEAERLARRIAEQDEPLLFQDPLGRDRVVYLQHIGDDPEKGWVGILAFAPGAPREARCVLDWVPERDVFVDPCGDEVFPAGGEGLTTFPAEVDDRGIVVVDLRTSG